MKTNRWIELSQRLYGWLLHLYPRAYRNVYAVEMLHFFTDQCRESYGQQGRRGILALWPRTLLDIGVTAILEQLRDPQVTRGLLEAAPGAPLPWKGVLLVLVPGLVFFVSQIAQVTSTQDWFFLAYYRAAYFLILPVLLIWVITRRFPVWGLIPFGLLYETIWTSSQRIQFSQPVFLSQPSDVGTQFIFYGLRTAVDMKYLLLVPAGLVAVGVLVGYNAHRRRIPGAAWYWLGLYGLLTIFQIASEAYRFIVAQDMPLSILWKTDNLWNYLIPMPFWYLYDSLAFLLLVFIGNFFARKHGGLSFLVLLGYLLPTVIFGRYGMWNESVPFLLVSLAVLLYRFGVALAAPLWLVRTASAPGRRRAVAIPVGIAILSQISLSAIAYLIGTDLYGFSPNLLDFALGIWNQLLIAAGLGLAVALYLPRSTTPGRAAEPLAVTE